MYSQAFVPTTKDNRIANFDIPRRKTVSFIIKIDNKGRILIPAEIRNTVGLNNNIDIRLDFLLSSSKILVEISPENGCVGVVDRIGACGAPGPGSIPGRGLKNKGGV